MSTSTTTTRKVFRTPIPERSTRVYRCTLKDTSDEDEPVIARASMTHIKMWLKTEDGTVINSRNGTTLTLADVMEATSGKVAIPLTADDNQIVSSTLAANRRETHILTLHFSYSGGEQWHEVELYVENLDVPPV